eukprot:1150117-Prymnesium_polylepis.1
MDGCAGTWSFGRPPYFRRLYLFVRGFNNTPPPRSVMGHASQVGPEQHTLHNGLNVAAGTPIPDCVRRTHTKAAHTHIKFTRMRKRRIARAQHTSERTTLS